MGIRNWFKVNNKKPVKVEELSVPKASDDPAVDPHLDSTHHDGKISPMRELSRGGTAISIHPSWDAAVLSLKVENALPGYYYRLGYYGNGVLISGAPNYGITVFKIPVENINKQHKVMSYQSSSSVVFDRTKGGIQTAVANGFEDAFTRISLTVDVDKLPPEGSQIISMGPAHHGYNCIIDPASYIYANASTYAGSNLHVEWDQSTGKLMVGYMGGAKWYRITFARKSINNTFSILNFAYADAYDLFGALIPIEYAMWEERGESETDWISPIFVRAINHGDEGNPIYTSGSHGSDGNSGGMPTAQSMLVQVFVDNAPLILAKSTKLIAKKITVVSVNRVKGYNTLASGRFVLEEYFTFTLDGRGVHVHKRAVALEPVNIEADNGCQMTMKGMTPVSGNSYLMFGGDQTVRRLMDRPFVSGVLNEYPKVYGISIRHPRAGEFTGWVDPNFGVGKRTFVPGHLSRLRFRTTGKVYFRLFYRTTPMMLQAGESYEWRGGYYYGTPTNTEHFDTVVQVQDGVLLVKHDGTYAVA